MINIITTPFYHDQLLTCSFPQLKQDKDKEKRKNEPPPPTRVGRKKKRGKNVGPQAYKVPTGKKKKFKKTIIKKLKKIIFLKKVTPTTRCRLRLLKLERVKDYLLMEEEYIQNQELHKPQEEKAQVIFGQNIQKKI